MNPWVRKSLCCLSLFGVSVLIYDRNSCSPFLIGTVDRRKSLFPCSCGKKVQSVFGRQL